MTLNLRLVLALLIAVSGLTLAGVAVLRSGTKSKERPPQPLPRPEVSAALAPTVIDTRPTGADVAVVLERARAIAATRMDSALALERPDDLVAAFREHLCAVVDGDFVRHRAALAARGIDLPDVPATRDGWTGLARTTQFAAMGLERLVVRVIYRNGRRVAAIETGQGFGRAESRRVLDSGPLPRTPEAGALTIVEVQLPMELPAEAGGQRKIAIVGFRFAWHQGRNQWLPWSIVQLQASGVPASALPM